MRLRANITFLGVFLIILMIFKCHLINRLRSVSNMIEKEWLELSKDTFKLNVKIHIIQDGLSLWQYLL
jgi:hypothetical protein